MTIETTALGGVPGTPAPDATAPVTPGTPDGTPAPDAPAPEPEAKPDRYAEHFAKLARKERELQKQSETVKAQLSDYEALKARIAEFEAKETASKQKPRDVLSLIQEHGFDPLEAYQYLTQFHLNGGKLSPEQQIALMQRDFDAKLDALRNEGVEKETQSAQAKVDAQIDSFKGSIAEAVKSGKFELITASDATGQAIDTVYEIVRAQWEQTGRVITVDEACGMLETHLEQEYLDRLAKVPKLKNRFQPTAPQVDGAASNAPHADAGNSMQHGAAKPPSFTLSNSLAPTAATTPASHSVSLDDLTREAAKLIKFI